MTLDSLSSEEWTGNDRTLFKKSTPRYRSRLCSSVGGADFPGETARFFFERANSELRTTSAVAEIFAAPLFESARALALRDVNEIVQNQFAIVPSVNADNQRVTKPHAPSVVCDDANPFRNFGQVRIVGKRDPIDHHQSNATGFFNTGQLCIGHVACA